MTVQAREVWLEYMQGTPKRYFRPWKICSSLKWVFIHKKKQWIWMLHHLWKQRCHLDDWLESSPEHILNLLWRAEVCDRIGRCHWLSTLDTTRKMTLPEYYGGPVYWSLATLKSNNGLMNALAANGTKKKKTITSWCITTVDRWTEDQSYVCKTAGMLSDEQSLVIYTINKALLLEDFQ